MHDMSSMVMQVYSSFYPRKYQRNWPISFLYTGQSGAKEAALFMVYILQYHMLSCQNLHCFLSVIIAAILPIRVNMALHDFSFFFLQIT